MIVAVGENGEIGMDNKLPWKQKADLILFKDLTSGTTVVMGRNTWKSIPQRFRPLPNRINMVISGTLEEADGAIIVASVEDAIERAEEAHSSELWFMGGRGVYMEALKLCDKVVITRIRGEFPDADTHLKEVLDMKAQGYILCLPSSEFPADDDNQYNYMFEIWIRRPSKEKLTGDNMGERGFLEMKEPKFPLSRIVVEGSTKMCNICNSSIHFKNFILFKIYSNGCIQPECKNYYDNDRLFTKSKLFKTP